MIWRTLSECESYMVSAGDKVVRPIFFGKGLERIEEIQQGAQTLRQELKAIDERLAGSPWLVGDTLTAADIGVFPLIQLLRRAASKEAAQLLNLGLLPLEKTFLHIARWVQRIESLPNYQRTYPPHWRQ